MAASVAGTQPAGEAFPQSQLTDTVSGCPSALENNNIQLKMEFKFQKVTENC